MDYLHLLSGLSQAKIKIRGEKPLLLGPNIAVSANTARGPVARSPNRALNRAHDPEEA
jgi:hypothetical protein